MTITLNHTLVPAYDKHASARFLADLLGLRVTDRSPGSPVGRFVVVSVTGVSLDFDEVENFEPHHYAFAVSDDDFDAILARIEQAALSYSADPHFQKVQEINNVNGGRGLYVHDPNGHNLEFLTRPDPA